VLDTVEDGHEIWTCECDADYYGDWIGPNCNFHVLDGWAIFFYILILIMIGAAVFTYFRRKRNKARAKERRENALVDAEKEKDQALANQKEALEALKADMTYPDTWDMVSKPLARCRNNTPFLRCLFLIEKHISQTGSGQT
jgi:hypothetical protein